MRSQPTWRLPGGWQPSTRRRTAAPAACPAAWRWWIPLEAVEDADALLVVTEWKCFQNPDWARLASLMRQPLVLDGRNLYEPGLMDELGIEYHGIDRRGRVRLIGRVRPDDRLVSPA